jgi:holin-like protein
MMIHGLAALLACQLAGESIARGLSLPVPGPVIGIVILLLAFAAMDARTGRDPAEADTLGIASTADGFLKHLSLLFVPAGVGVFAIAPALGTHALPLAVALIVSTAVTLAATVMVFAAVKRRFGGDAP